MNQETITDLINICTTFIDDNVGLTTREGKPHGYANIHEQEETIFFGVPHQTNPCQADWEEFKDMSSALIEEIDRKLGIRYQIVMVDSNCAELRIDNIH